MTTKFYINGEKTTRKAVKEQLGEDRLKRMLEEAKEGFREDPLELQSFFTGNGTLEIEFC